MIIICINCNKKFEVDSSLIPKNGRTVKCGSCNHIWFYASNLQTSSVKSPSKKVVDSNIISKKDDSKSIVNNSQIINDNSSKKIFIPSDNFRKNKVTKTNFNKKVKTSLFNRFLSYFIVSIISFIALIIILDTFKAPIVNIYPDIEIFLYNFFETLKDIFLFLKNLFI